MAESEYSVWAPISVKYPALTVAGNILVHLYTTDVMGNVRLIVNVCRVFDTLNYVVLLLCIHVE